MGHAHWLDVDQLYLWNKSAAGIVFFLTLCCLIVAAVVAAVRHRVSRRGAEGV